MIRLPSVGSILVLETGNDVRATQIHQCGLELCAEVHSPRASRLERTAFARQGRGRRIAGDNRELILAAFFVFHGDCGKRFEERLSVGMFRRAKNGFRRTPFDNLSGIKNQDAIGKTAEQGRVVSNKNHRETEGFAERTKYGENFHLGDRVERSGRLIGDHNRGIAGDGLGDEGALPLASAELVGIGAQDTAGILRKQLGENLARPFIQSRFRRGLVRCQHLANLLADTDCGMEGQGRLLKDESDAGAADLAEFLGGGLEKIFAFKEYCAAPDVAVRREKAQNRRRERAFARAGFAENAQNFAGPEVKTDAGQNRARADFARTIRYLQILDIENGRHRPAASGLPPLQFMLRQEAGRDKGNVVDRAPKVIRHDEDGKAGIWKRIAGIPEGGIPAIQYRQIVSAQLPINLEKRSLRKQD